jgi:hypothetical protein
MEVSGQLHAPDDLHVYWNLLATFWVHIDGYFIISTATLYRVDWDEKMITDG